MDPVIFDSAITLDDIIAVARGRQLELSDSFRQRVRDAYDTVNRLVAEEGNDLYGATTGVAGQVRVTREATGALVGEFARNYFKAHAAAVGRPVSQGISRATLAARIWMFGHGKSGVHPSFVDSMVRFLNTGAAVVVPRDGSLGASGDLCSLGTIAAAFLRLKGTSVIMPDGTTRDASEAMSRLGIDLPELGYKDALGHSNGVTFSAVMALDALVEARRLVDAALRALVLNFEALGAWLDPFEEGNDAIRPHRLTSEVRRRVRELTDGSELVASLVRLDGRKANRPLFPHWGGGDATLEEYQGFQSPYSLRAMAEYFGPTLAALEDLETALTVELLHSVGDNPILDDGRFIHAAHFHGQPLAALVTNLKPRLAELAIMLKETASIMIRGDMNQGLGDYLSLGKGYSGYMILEYTMTALAGELKSLANPETITSMYSAGGQENIVSMLPLTIKNLRRQLEALATLVGGSFLMGGMALDLRLRAARQAGSEVASSPYAAAVLATMKKLLGERDGNLAHIDYDDLGTTVTWQLDTVTACIDQLIPTPHNN